MAMRDECETFIRQFHALEVSTGGVPVVDYDCTISSKDDVLPFADRLAALNALEKFAEGARGSVVAEQAKAHATYLSALLGKQYGFAEYIERTQGCPARGWTKEYISDRREIARKALDNIGVTWGENTRKELNSQEEKIPVDSIGDAIKHYASQYEQDIRRLTGTDANYVLKIENVESDRYWSYWLDGAGYEARLRINVTNASFTQADAYLFALHEVLGHALQYASITHYARYHAAEWPRLLAVHSNHQVLFEGLAQVLPLVARRDDPKINAIVRLDHYTQLARAELHVLLNAGATISECYDLIKSNIPFLQPKDFERELHDRSRDPQLRSYLWAYAAGIDWFMNLVEQRATLLPEVLRVAYQRPLSPSQLQQLWPDGPAIGGNC
jgi:hypothetical protein